MNDPKHRAGGTGELTVGDMQPALPARPAPGWQHGDQSVTSLTAWSASASRPSQGSLEARRSIETFDAAWRAGAYDDDRQCLGLAKAVDDVWQLLWAGLGPGLGATGPVLAKKMPYMLEPSGAGTPPAKRKTQARTGGPRQSTPPAPTAGSRAVMPTSPARVGGGCTWEPGSTPRDCLTENHMVLLRSLEGEERREAVRRIKRSRKAFLQVDNAISECLPSLEGSSFSSRDSASIAEKATSPKSVRMLRRSSWSGPSGSAAVCGGQGPVCVSQWLPHRRQWLRERSVVWGSEYEGKIADQTPRPSQPQGDPVLSPMFRLLGLTPRFSSSLAEQMRKDTGLLLSEPRGTRANPKLQVGNTKGSRKSTWVMTLTRFKAR